MAINASKFDIIYGKLLSLGYSPIRAKDVGFQLYTASVDLGISVSEVIKYIDGTGSKFQSEIAGNINKQNPNGSQIGILTQSQSVPSFITEQVIILPTTTLPPTTTQAPTTTAAPTTTTTAAPTTPAPDTGGDAGGGDAGGDGYGGGGDGAGV